MQKDTKFGVFSVTKMLVIMGANLLVIFKFAPIK